MAAAPITRSGASRCEKAVDLAREWTRRAVIGIVRESGGQMVTRPLFRGRPALDITVTDVEPLAGLQAATGLKHGRGAALVPVDVPRVPGDGHRPGTDAGHPEDCEQGHARGCPRLAATVTAWDASWDTDGGERGAQSWT